MHPSDGWPSALATKKSTIQATLLQRAEQWKQMAEFPCGRGFPWRFFKICRVLLADRISTGLASFFFFCVLVLFFRMEISSEGFVPHFRVYRYLNRLFIGTLAGQSWDSKLGTQTWSGRFRKKRLIFGEWLDIVKVVSLKKPPSMCITGINHLDTNIRKWSLG